jgi:hemerythrin-like domain-containing protein
MKTASDLLRQEHRQIETHLDGLRDALVNLQAPRVAEVRHHFQAIRTLAALHFRKEEEIFYPCVRGLDPDLLAEMDEQHEESRQAERDLEALLAGLPEAPSERDLTELHRLGLMFDDIVQTHILAEEDRLLPWADRSLGVEEQHTLAIRMDRLQS